MKDCNPGVGMYFSALADRSIGSRIIQGLLPRNAIRHRGQRTVGLKKVLEDVDGHMESVWTCNLCCWPNTSSREISIPVEVVDGEHFNSGRNGLKAIDPSEPIRGEVVICDADGVVENADGCRA